MSADVETFGRMTRRPLKVRVATRPAPVATNDPAALAEALTLWLLGRSNQVPALHLPRRTS